jgi:hypothetical protein
VFFIKHLFTKARVATADKKYDNYAFVDAKTYERVADKGYKSVDMFQNWETPITSMGSSKKQLNGELFAMTQRWNQLNYRYAQSLRSISENDKANQIMEKFDHLETIVEGNFCQNEIIWIKANSGRYNEEEESILYPIMELPFMQIK